jgi:signal transduction protein with GAF and PtsI domain
VSEFDAPSGTGTIRTTIRAALVFCIKGGAAFWDNKRVKARELEARLERVEQQLRLFQRVSRLMTREMDLDDVLHEIVTLVRDFLKCDSSLIYLVEEGELVLYATSDMDQRNIGEVRLRLSEGLTGWVARERRLLAISREAYSDPRFKFFKDLPQDTFEAFLSVPIISQGRVVGVINVQNREARVHSGDDMEMLTTIGEQVGCLLVLSKQKTTAFLGALS